MCLVRLKLTKTSHEMSQTNEMENRRKHFGCRNRPF